MTLPPLDPATPRRFSDFTVFGKWLLPLLMAGFLSLATACGGGGQSPTVGGTTPGTSPPPSVASSSPTSTPTEPRYPNLGKFTDPLDRFSYKSAYSDCRLLGLNGEAEAYGGEPEDPPSVARAYAAFVHGAQQGDPAFHGCLDAFEEER